MATAIKGPPVTLIQGATSERTSELAVDCRRWNAVALQVILAGAGATATITVLGSRSEQGQYAAVSDPSGTATVTASQVLQVVVGPLFAKVRVSSITGSVTVRANPFVCPGPVLVRATL